MHFTDAQHGWAVGDQGTIIDTTNGGSAWAAQSSGTGDDLTGVTFTDAHDGWATGQSYTGDDYSSGFILHTTNGGQDWTRQYDSPSDSTAMASGVAFEAIAFADAHDGWAVGETQGPDQSYNSFVIMHTSDGGATWTQQLDYNPSAGGIRRRRHADQRRLHQCRERRRGGLRRLTARRSGTRQTAARPGRGSGRSSGRRTTS